MTSIFPGGNALNAANITKSSKINLLNYWKKFQWKEADNRCDDAGNINKVNNLKAKVLSTKAAIRSVTDIMSRLN